MDGYIKIVNSDGSVLAQPFLDIDNLVRNISGISEQGFLGLAFHPNYSANGYFYVNYIDNSNNTVISRFSRLNENLADPSSELKLLNINQPFGNHNGGSLNFGDDGFLYIALGDGGSGGDPQNNAQDLSTLLGKILRIDVDNVSGGFNYAIPSDNPFLSNIDARDEIWAYGLRNPWKFSFDKQNGDIWIGDVGQNSFEEINMAQSEDSGINYGWRCYEANTSFNLTGCPPENTIVFPISQYVNGSRCAITGGFRYRGSDFPNFEGVYFFADYCSSEIGTLRENGSDWTLEFLDSYPGNNWSSFGEDVNGELFLAGIVSGSIYKIVDTEVLDIEKVDNETISIYPNPVADELTLDFGNYSSEQLTLSIYDSRSRLITTNNITKSQKKVMGLNQLNPGFYILHVQSKSGISTSFKFLKL